MVWVCFADSEPQLVIIKTVIQRKVGQKSSTPVVINASWQVLLSDIVVLLHRTKFVWTYFSFINRFFV